MSSDRRLQIDYSRPLRTVLGSRVPLDDQNDEWTPEREQRSHDISDAWRVWLAAERERRGNPTWQPF